MEPNYEIKEQPSQPLLSKAQKRLALFAFGLLSGIVLCIYASSAPARFPEAGAVFSVAPGESLKSVGGELKQLGYIRSRVLLATFVTFEGGEHTISPGDYSFVQGESLLGIARQIAHGDHNLNPIKVTIPEGQNLREISATLTQKLPGFVAADFVQAGKSFEGYLYPETYFFYPKTAPDEIVKEMRAMFDTQTAEVLGPDSLGSRSRSDVVIMASLVEREAHGADDRAIIAAILWKRLALHMPLQVDATVAYANGIPESALRKSDFSIDSPYNTYKYKGLPPGPIGNPGLEALTAATGTTATPYLYYLHDSHGTIHYARSYSEQLANIRKYLK